MEGFLSHDFLNRCCIQNYLS